MDLFFFFEFCERDDFVRVRGGNPLEMIEEGLIPFGLYGKRRATICSTLILDMLKQPAVQEHIREGRAKKKSD